MVGLRAFRNRKSLGVSIDTYHSLCTQKTITEITIGLNWDNQRVMSGLKSVSERLAKEPLHK